MKRMNSIALACTVLLMLGALVAAQDANLPERINDPATQPTTMPRDGDFFERGPFGRLSPRDQSRALSFAQTHLPHLYQMTMRSDRWRRSGLLFYVWQRQQMIDRLAADQEAYDKAVKSFESEDEVYRFVMEYFDASQADRAAVRLRVEAKVREAIDNSLAERNERLSRLRERLDDQMTKLQEDRDNKEVTIDRRVKRLLGETGPGRPFAPDANSSANSPTTSQ